MPRSFLVKKKRGACGAWQWKEPEQHEWKDDNLGKNSMYVLIISTNLLLLNLLSVTVNTCTVFVTCYEAVLCSDSLEVH